MISELAPQHPSTARLSVVMPYYENARTLGPCLEALAQQIEPPDEVIVCDDGSQEAAEPIIEAFGARRRRPFPVRALVGAHGGQSAATNRALAAAQGDIVLMTCADIVAHPMLVKVHHEAHRRAPDEVAVAGYLPYHPDVAMTPFMRYLAETAVQFGFGRIPDPESMSFVACYAPNFSARTTSLRAIGGFDEAFVYGYQDTDLGKRLAARGVRFVYREGAIGYHDHPTTLARFVGRQRRVGEATLTWIEKWRDEAERDKMRQVVAMYRPFVAGLPSALVDTERLEAKLAASPRLWARLGPRLFKLYDLITNTAVVAGMLDEPERTARVLAPAHGAT